MSKPFEVWPEVMRVPEVVDCLGLPRDQVYAMFRRPDFPLLIPEAKKSRSISKYQLVEWLKKPRR